MRDERVRGRGRGEETRSARTRAVLCFGLPALPSSPPYPPSVRPSLCLLRPSVPATRHFQSRRLRSCSPLVLGCLRPALARFLYIDFRHPRSLTRRGPMSEPRSPEPGPGRDFRPRTYPGSAVVFLGPFRAPCAAAPQCPLSAWFFVCYECSSRAGCVSPLPLLPRCACDFSSG
jgi:hypothetical protein